MSTTAPSLSSSGYTTPLSAVSSSTSLPSTSKVPPRPKPVNVFSDDGSFLERFQRSKKEEEDKCKADDALLKKKQFADRFKNRGKRAQPDSSPSVTNTDSEGNPTKKAKVQDPPLTGYQKEVKDYAGKSLETSCTSVRPLYR